MSTRSDPSEDLLGDDALAFLDDVYDESLLLDIPAAVDDALATDEALLRDGDALLGRTASTPNAASTASMPAVTANATAKPKQSGTAAAKDAGRRRQKDELAYLRAKVKELEHELAELQGASPTVSTPTTDHESDDVVDPALPVVPMWQRLAKNQQMQKHKAQLENTKLREMLEGQIRMAHSLEKILRKRPTPEDIAGANAKRLRVESVDERDVFASLASEVASLHFQLPLAFEDAGITHLTTEMRDGRVKGTMSSGVYIELIDCRCVPFPPHELGAAVFQVLSRERVDLPNGQLRIIDSSSDSASCRGVVTTKLRRTQVTIILRVVLKRIVDGDREVLVWRGLASTEESSTSALSGITVRESGWATIEQVGSASMIKCCVRMEPELPGLAGSPQQGLQHVGLLSDLVLGSYHQNMSVLHQQIENAMMETLLERS